MIQKWVSPKAFSNGISVLNILIKELVLLVTSVNLKSSEISSSLISTLKFQFEKIDKFNNITVAIFNAYLISTLKFENIKHFWEIPKIWKNKKIKNQFEKKV